MVCACGISWSYSFVFSVSIVYAAPRLDMTTRTSIVSCYKPVQASKLIHIDLVDRLSVSKIKQAASARATPFELCFSGVPIVARDCMHKSYEPLLGL